MAVAQEFVDVFIRIEDINRVYPGGIDAYLQWVAEDLGSTVWHDAHLVREGAMSSGDAEGLVDEWAKRGLTTYREDEGEPVEWLEVCVSIGIAGQPTLPCAWIAYDDATGGVYLRGTAPGHLVGPSESRRSAEDDQVWIRDPTFLPHP